MKIKKIDIFFTILFIFTLGSIITVRCINGFEDILWLMDIRVLAGVLSVIFLAKHKWATHPLGIIATVLSGITAILQHVWLTSIITFAISLPMTILALINWNKNKKAEKPVVKKLSKKQYLIISLIFLVAIVPSMFLIYYLNGNVWYIDSILFVLTFIRLFLYANLYLDMFFILVVDNVLNISMFTILSFQNQNNILSVVMFLILIPINIIALINWKKLYKQQQENNFKTVQNNKAV